MKQLFLIGLKDLFSLFINFYKNIINIYNCLILYFKFIRQL